MYHKSTHYPYKSGGDSAPSFLHENPTLAWDEKDHYREQRRKDAWFLVLKLLFLPEFLFHLLGLETAVSATKWSGLSLSRFCLTEEYKQCLICERHCPHMPGSTCPYPSCMPSLSCPISSHFHHCSRLSNPLKEGEKHFPHPVHQLMSLLETQ